MSDSNVEEKSNSSSVQLVIEDISSFEQTVLRHVDQVNEKNPLPSKEGIRLLIVLRMGF
jgi:hypothetical protein